MWKEIAAQTFATPSNGKVYLMEASTPMDTWNSTCVKVVTPEKLLL